MKVGLFCMSRKSKFSYEIKLKAIKKYLNGEASVLSIAKLIGADESTLRHWIHAFKAQGPEALKPHNNNQRYSKEFKLKCVAANLTGKGSYNSLTHKFCLRSSNQLKQWVIKYNSHQELKDYNPAPEAYMTKIKKTTLEERKQIVEYCKDHEWNYKEAALKFGCSYAQVYNWSKKYREQGFKSLEDRRGRHLKVTKLSETQRLKREVEQLKRENKLKDQQIAFLKKVKELERMCLLDNQSKDK